MMNYIWGIFHFSNSIPNDRMFINVNSDECKFYPFDHKGHIFTIDSSLWVSEIENEEIFYPDMERIQAELLAQQNTENRMVKMIACYSKPVVKTIDANNDMTICSLSADMNKLLCSNYTNIGFDIVDVTGISGLTNIGYNSQESKNIISLSLSINEWGLIDNKENAGLFASLVSNIASEHAPFLPMSVWLKKENG